MTAAARGALLAALILALAGAVPGARVDARFWLAALAVLLGLVEAKARARVRIPAPPRSLESGAQ